MRLRIRIERNALPPTQAIWPVKDNKSTIAQLVQHINEVFPLEGETWGLEDYSVSVDGYECLHYHELDTVCRDEDEVVIKPLQYAEVRARTLAGRDQIAADGRHLVDGVPYGRPCLKAPVRPELRIPPRKKRQLLEHGLEDEEAAPLMLTEHGEELDDDDEDEEDEDEDFEMEESESDASSVESTSGSDSEDNDDSGFEQSDSSSSASSSDDTSDSDSDESWNGIPTSAPATPTFKTTSKVGNGITESRSVTSPTGSKRKRESDDESHEREIANETKVAKVDRSPPGEGISQTKQRNARRRDAKKLKHLKRVQVLPQDATMQSMREWEKENPDWEPGANDCDVVKAEVEGEEGLGVPSERDAAMLDVEGGAERNVHITRDGEIVVGHPPPVESEVPQPIKISNKKTRKLYKGSKPVDDNLDEQRQKLMSAIESGGVDVTKHPKKRNRIRLSPDETHEDNEPPEEISSTQQHARSKQNESIPSVDHNVDEATLLVPPSVARRSQLDLASSKRLLFGSLGVRVPRTQAEKDRVQKKLAERPKRNASSMDQVTSGSVSTAPNGTNTTAGAAIDEANAGIEENSEAWRDKINLTAVECCDEGVTLSTPPFPFYQRWDPQQRKKKAGRRVSNTYMDGNVKRSRGKQNAHYVESYDKYNINGTGDALDYDEVDGGNDEYWDDDALLNGDYDEEVEIDDGFPSLPANLEDLSALDENGARKDDFIAFTELACDESTEWQPKMVTRTAKVIDLPTNGDSDRLWVLQLAARDFKAKAFDDEGNRVYSKFEMPEDDADADVDEEGRREVSWADLGVVRLVLRPEVEINGSP